MSTTTTETVITYKYLMNKTKSGIADLALWILELRNKESILLDAEKKRSEKLEAALQDMLLLIEEHGSKVMKAHGTRIMQARQSFTREEQLDKRENL